MAPSFELCCHLYHAASAPLLWRTPGSVSRWRSTRSLACCVRGRAAGPYWRRRARAPPRTGRLESVAQPHSRMKSPRQDPLAFCLSISSTNQRFSDFLRGSQIFSREKTVAPARKNTNAATTKTPVPALKKTNAYTQKPQCRDHKNTNACAQKPQCRDHKNPNACARKPHCLDTRCGRGPVPTHVSFRNSRV